MRDETSRPFSSNVSEMAAPCSFFMSNTDTGFMDLMAAVKEGAQPTKSDDVMLVTCFVPKKGPKTSPTCTDSRHDG